MKKIVFMVVAVLAMLSILAFNISAYSGYQGDRGYCDHTDSHHTCEHYTDSDGDGICDNCHDGNSYSLGSLSTGNHCGYHTSHHRAHCH